MNNIVTTFFLGDIPQSMWFLKERPQIHNQIIRYELMRLSLWGSVIQESSLLILEPYSLCMIFVLQGKAPYKRTLVTKVQWKLYYPCLTLTSLLRRNNHVTQGQASWKYRQALCDRLLIFMQKSKTTKPLHLSIFVLQQLVTNGLAHWFLLPPSPLYSRKNKIQFPNSGIRKKSKLQPRPSLQNKYPLFS